MGQYNRIETAYFAGGSFWCLAAIFRHVKGVVSLTCGYAGGEKSEPRYEDVKAGDTGHVETVKIEYDQALIGYVDLLRVFFFVHDPTGTDLKWQFTGPQYRSTIFYDGDEQKITIENFIKEMQTAKAYEKPIMTEVRPFAGFNVAEDGHQRYFEENLNDPYCAFVIVPRIEKFKERFKKFYKD